MLLFLYKISVRGMTTRFEQISKKNRYGYARVSSKEQAQNSSLEAQKTELIQLGVPEENIYLEIGSATDVIENRPIFFFTTFKYDF
jgi:predicted site-specific integrase-resolvase